MKRDVAAIVLAAGASRRLGQPKQLLVHQGEPLIARAMRLAEEAGARPVLVVLGARYESICSAVAFNGAITVINDEWQQGIASSIHAGLKALDATGANVAGSLILTCDQPRLTADHLTALIDAFEAQAEPSIAASTYAKTTGIPALFPRSVFPHLLALKGDQGARVLLTHPPCPITLLPLQDGEIDIDLPDDLMKLE